MLSWYPSNYHSDCLITLFNATALDINKNGSHPLAMVELIGIILMKESHKLLGLDPIDVLLLGN